ncbi:hypothetical protein CC80DRAFT_490024 [Byssothecium circinans]|uniref:HTH araC/xylS-type domain-containing protein n=1 Tax=Byssothecium circinans TaxID=147558 RepID=A0A6A5U828_9PLEO|nr:hypothetical protein CC80DRAFT_490024 [Byssothecium circinans]
MSFITDAARWRALSTRDATANDHFVYIVKSTRIYCRPTCPARLARRANIGFCNTPAQAEAAGYRACKRCKPDVKSTEDPQEKAVAKACTLIAEAVSNGGVNGSLRLQDLARGVGLTPRYFHKIFKDKKGMTPKEYAKAKMNESRDGLAAAPHDTMVDLNSFNLAAFDFNDLVNFDLEEPLPMEEPLPTMDSLPGMFGIEIDANVQGTAPALGTFDPNVVDAGLLDVDKVSKCIESETALMATTAAFELDAALVLNSETLSDLNQGMYKDIFM